MPEPVDVIKAGELEAGARRKSRKSARKSRSKKSRRSMRGKRTASGRRSLRRRKYPNVIQKAPRVSPAQVMPEAPLFTEEVVVAPRFRTRRANLTPLLGPAQRPAAVTDIIVPGAAVSPLRNAQGAIVNVAEAVDFSTPVRPQRSLLSDITGLFTGPAQAAVAAPVAAAAAVAAPVAAAAQAVTDPFASLLGGKRKYQVSN